MIKFYIGLEKKLAEKILIILLLFIFTGTFMARNLIVKSKIKQPVRASDPLLTTSIVVTTLCIVITTISVYSDGFYRFSGAILFLKQPLFSTLGLSLFAISIVIGWFVSAQLKESWRVGVHNNQKTQLIQNGIYQYIRNPYFLSYFMMFIGLLLIRPSFVLLVLVVADIVLFHRLVIKEEKYLLTMHGTGYEQYKQTTGRYLPRVF